LRGFSSEYSAVYSVIGKTQPSVFSKPLFTKIFEQFGGKGVSVAAGVDVIVGWEVGVEVGVLVGVDVGVDVAVAVGVGVFVGVGDGVIVGVGEGRMLGFCQMNGKYIGVAKSSLVRISRFIKEAD
jgi:hypothetical protein